MQSSARSGSLHFEANSSSLKFLRLPSRSRSSSVATSRTLVSLKWRTVCGVLLTSAAGIERGDVDAQVKDDIFLSSFKIVATEGRMLTSNPRPVSCPSRCPCLYRRRVTLTRLVNEAVPFVSITRTYLQMAIQRMCARVCATCLAVCIEDRWKDVRSKTRARERHGLIDAVEVLTLRTRISRLARIAQTTSEFKLISGRGLYGRNMPHVDDFVTNNTFWWVTRSIQLYTTLAHTEKQILVELIWNIDKTTRGCLVKYKPDPDFLLK